MRDFVPERETLSRQFGAFVAVDAFTVDALPVCIRADEGFDRLGSNGRGIATARKIPAPPLSAATLLAFIAARVYPRLAA